MAHDVFISHSSKDKTIADATCAWIEAKGIRCWIAPRDILPGADWGVSIIDGINDARVMVLLLSAQSNASPQIKREVERAVNRGIIIIPMRIEDVLPARELEYFLSTPHWLDAFTEPLEDHLDFLAATIQQILAGPDAASVPIPRPPSRKKPWWQKNFALLVGSGAAAIMIILLLIMVLRPSTPQGPTLLQTAGAPAAVTATTPAAAPAPAPGPSDSELFTGTWKLDSMDVSANTGIPSANAYFNTGLPNIFQAALSTPHPDMQLTIQDDGQYKCSIAYEDNGTYTVTSLQPGDRTDILVGKAAFKSDLNGSSDAPNVSLPHYYASPNAMPVDSLTLTQPGGFSKTDLMRTHVEGVENTSLVGHWTVMNGVSVYTLMGYTSGSPGGYACAFDITDNGRYKLSVDMTYSGLLDLDGKKFQLKTTGGPFLWGQFTFQGKDTLKFVTTAGAMMWKRVSAGAAASGP